NADVWQVVTAQGRSARAIAAAFDANDPSSAFAEIPREDTGARPELDDVRPRPEPECAQEIRATPRQVISRRPVSNECLELVGGGTAILADRQRMEYGRLRSVSVVDTVADELETGIDLCDGGRR